MKKTDWTKPVVVIIAFMIGIIVNIMARKLLPGILPESWAGKTELIAMLLQILIPVAIIIVFGRIFYKEDD